ncbi:CDP-glycerol glycerophosphotransferase family protein [Kineothrix sp. MB12-C1]|uniref:CDP-glycerol glycerophosphotransferase family protein n=1 Tax=Kineothrix sp. MB12-C1 TaxID=3070215 RepID=UPI0027D30DDD|nr:CDP-glycerol glycerophosphotransferase family protein [Kineothrix sp. MB12-C1]WMC93869.1 CDP-glycerol glycerophosphotransferase family protein [Kineothrix sp. MB12-C1]
MGRLSIEERYIRKRKRECIRTSMFYYLLRIFPIHKDKIVFTTFEGDGGYCCNPRYIAEELLKRNEEFEIIWLVNNMERQFPSGIKKVKNNFLNRAYHLSTAKVWIDNSRKAYGTVKRKKQLYIQTWHAALEFKPVGKFRGKLFPRIAYMVSEYDSRLIDYVTSNSDWCTRLYPEMLLYSGDIIKTGSPRCDIFINKRNDTYKSVRERYGVPQDIKIALFAPTFRGGSQKGNRQVFIEEPTIDFKQMVDALGRKFGGTWYVFLRLHPQLAAQLDKYPLKNKVANMIDVSQADDMNELAAASDILITDYSSSAFDVINMYMPVFIYADDLNQYTEERGKLMWDMYSLPFSVAVNNDELIENIEAFEEEEYRNKIDDFSQEHGVLEDGHASERIVEWIEKYLYNKKAIKSMVRNS